MDGGKNNMINFAASKYRYRMTAERENHITVRVARADDAERLLEIYRPYVNDTAITFEYDVPGVDEFRRRIETTLLRYPYLVAEMPDGTIVGYAYASAFKERAAYNWAVELSVYVDQTRHHGHIGQTLYEALEYCLKQQHVTNLNACITFTEQEDGHLDNGSVAFHEKMGFERVAHFHECGYKFNHWWDMIWMEKIIAPHDTLHADFLPFDGMR